MKKWLIFCLVVLIGSVLFQVELVKAQSNSVVSLEEGNIILPGSDIELTDGRDILYVVVNQEKRLLYQSSNKGRTWKKVAGRGLPEYEKFISLKTLTDQQVVVLATTTQVFISWNGGEQFDCLGGPPGLTNRGEEITSLDVLGGNPPQILVGIWHPSPGKFAEEGIFIWGFGGKTIWEAQGMKPTWGQRKGYFSDVTSVAFFLNSATILVVATGDPDGPSSCSGGSCSGSLPEGTYLNMAYPSGERTQWNDFPDWPIEITQTAGQSPNGTEILSSEITISEFDRREEKIYVIYNTRQRVKDDVYLVKLSEGNIVKEVRKLGIPKAPEILRLDSLKYYGNSTVGFLAVGITTVEGQNGGWSPDGGAGIIDGAHVYYLSSTNERFSPPYWENKWLRSGGYNTFNCQVVISEGVIFAGTSGPASCFARAEEYTLLPISLIDASPGIYQLSLSPTFREDRILYFNYGNRNILRLVLNKDYQLEEAARIFYFHQGFDQARIKIGQGSNQNLFLFETGTKRFWLSKDGGLNWLPVMEKEVEISDALVTGDKVWVAGKDGLIYLCQNTGVTQSRISSGLSWIGKIEPGPEGKVIVAGGSKENFYEGISLIDESQYQLLPTLPTAVSTDIQIVYSQKDNSIYFAFQNQLYRLMIGGQNWEKITDLNWQVAKLLVSSQGLYIFDRYQVYFSMFPVTKDSWQTLEIRKEGGGNWLGCQLVELEEKNILLLWDYSNIMVYTHEISEKEVVSPPPTEPKPASPQPVAPKPEPQPVTPSSQPVVQPKSTTDLSGAAVPIVIQGSIVFFVIRALRRRAQKRKLQP